MTTKNFKTLFTYETINNADSVEWCPISPYENYFACGTYQLVEGNMDSDRGKRKGTVLLFSVTKDSLNKKSIAETSAVLDMRWCPHIVSEKILLGVACSGGEIYVFFLSDECLKFLTKYCLKKGDDYLMLSLDWSRSAQYDIICTSDSKGDITLLKFVNNNLEIWKQWNSHSLEAWNACFDLFSPDILFSGGDDSKLYVWDTRTEKPNKIAGISKHKAGVTVLSCNPSNQHSLASGSYDETILIWDKRNWGEPMSVIPASGGLWRLKWEPRSRSSYLLAACIYGGFEIFRPCDAPSAVGRYKEHESLAYGADWCHNPGSEFLLANEQFLIATCSFYDQKLCVSLWDKGIDFIDS